MSLVHGFRNEDRMYNGDYMNAADNVDFGVANVFQHDKIWTEPKIC